MFRINTTFNNPRMSQLMRVVNVKDKYNIQQSKNESAHESSECLG